MHALFRFTPLGNIPRLPIVVCPADVQASGTVPGVSFVGNSGYWDANSAPMDYPENGVFLFRTGQSATNSISMDQIRDGLPKTMLFSEKIQAGPPDSPTGSPNEPTSWMLSPTERGDGFVWVSVPNVKQAQIHQAREDIPAYDGPAYCRPSSNHADGINVTFCDGHVGFIRDDIAYHVYQQLMTTYGRKARIPPNEALPTNALQIYVLDSSDYQS